MFHPSCGLATLSLGSIMISHSPLFALLVTLQVYSGNVCPCQFVLVTKWVHSMHWPSMYRVVECKHGLCLALFVCTLPTVGRSVEVVRLLWQRHDPSMLSGKHCPARTMLYNWLCPIRPQLQTLPICRHKAQQGHAEAWNAAKLAGAMLAFTESVKPHCFLAYWLSFNSLPYTVGGQSSY